ncbi:MAG: FtsQ-type POTRA domain-containing protein [Clostridiales bacterium]|nr:FtsQ-type POTRA domain-containing protein [Candidatus Apopatousia equi]
MKNKKLAICLIVLSFLAVVVILSSAIFALSSVELVFLTTTNNLEGKNEEIVESADFKMGSNVLFLRKKSYIENMEKNFPYLKVVNIETKFPNKLVINCVERMEVFAINLGDGNYAICDEEFKVLKKTTQFINSSNNAILLQGVKDIKSSQVGYELDFNGNQKSLLKQSFNSMREWDLSYNNLLAKIESMTIDYSGTSGDINLKMRSGSQILIVNANQYNSDKFNYAFSCYDSDVKYQNAGLIEVRLTNEGIEIFYRESTE